VQSTELVLVQNAAKAESRVARRKGFTLVEVMVATTLLTMVGLGILSVLVGAYRVAAKARYRDQARYVIKSFADQFLTQQPADLSGNTYTLFQVTVDTSGNSSPLGTGLNWTNIDGTTGTLSADTAGLYYYVTLGSSTSTPVQATVTRKVSYIASDGTATLIYAPVAAGDLLEGDFTIKYPYLGVTQTETISAIRAFP
jgi:prepilin-type N-terminal cleavage/methylation domain-containing protein